MDIKDMQKEVDLWVKANNGYWAPLSQFARLVEEVGELGRILNHVYGEKKKKPEESHTSTEEELGDVLFTAICIANSNSIDLESAYEKAIQKYNIRDKDRFK
ncbi:MAG: nucleotide pyrophosphohydrolase [archaeon]